jgi:Ca-activated chloride channel family protein
LKKKVRRITLLIFLFLFLFLNSFSFSNGIIIPVLPPHPPFPPKELIPLKMKSHNVNIEINNQIAKTTVVEVFENKNNVQIEGIYIFPIPPDANISSFSIFIDGKKKQAELLEKEKARNIYEEIVRKMKDPALLEYIDRGMIKLRIFPIFPKEEKKIQIEYLQVLKMRDNLCEYVYPLNIEKFIPEKIKELTITAKITSNIELKNIYSPNYEIAIKRESKNTAKISYEENNIKPDKDFILYYTVSEKELGLNLLTYKEKEEDGFFLLMASPKYEIEEDILPKEIVFVLDTSGSMAGEKIKQARETLLFCIENLNPEDKFNIIDFNSEVTLYEKNLIRATEKEKKEAKKYIKKLKATGGTDINSALIKGIEIFEKNNLPKFIIFLTDGLPTVGETDVSKIIENINKKNDKNIRIFTFGLGYDVNTILLDKISYYNRGISEYVKPEENIEFKISSFYEKIKNPILTNIELKIEGIKTFQIYPKQFPDIFKGSQLIIVGKYSNSGGCKINLIGEFKNKKKIFEYTGLFPEENEKFEFIPVLWASQKIGFLLEEIRLKGENKELIEEIIELSKKYGIITPYTSFLLTEDKISSDEERIERFKASLPKEDTGELAFGTSSYITQMKKKFSISVTPPDSVKNQIWKVKNLGKKTFYFKDGIWTESDYNNEKTIQIKFLSEEYFKLLKLSPEIGKYISIGKNIIFKFKGKWYRIFE